MFLATVLVALLILVDLWSAGSVRSGIRGVAVWTGKGAESALAFVSRARFFTTRRALIAENETLRAGLRTLEEKTALLRILEEENAALRSELSLTKREKGITAPVASLFRSSPYGTFLIGAGEDGGVHRGDIILSGSGFVVGTVTDSLPTNALVTTVFAPGVATDATLSGVSLTVTGRGSGNARAEAPRSAKISVGDIVIAPEYGGRPIGVVGEIIAASGDATQELLIRVPVNLEVLRFVYVTSH